MATSSVAQLQSTPNFNNIKSCSVAVVGAGPAGLVTARELRREGHKVFVYEQNIGIGGVWRYSSKVEDDDLLGTTSNRKAVHSSVYLSLRTNLPREIMCFLDFPFLPKYQDSRDPRCYPGHQEVLCYLEDFAAHFELLPAICFGRRVTDIGVDSIVVEDEDSSNRTIPVDNCDIASLNALLQRHSLTGNVRQIQWTVTSEAVEDPLDISTEKFDAVVVCNGHYFQPKIASIQGIDNWPGKEMHSHNYRVPDAFGDQVVVVIGNSASGMDISREIATVAKEVHWASRTWEPSLDMKKPVGANGDIILHPMVESAHEDGSIKFEDGSSVVADMILYCTGYVFSVPCLKLEGIVNVDEGYIWPLYQHVFPPLLAPFLSFVGLPYKVVPFPLMELQSKWIAMSLSGKVELPSREEMNQKLQELYNSIEAKGLPKTKVHDITSCQFEYDDWLANECHYPSLESWRHQIFLDCSVRRRSNPYGCGYRDDWTEHDLHAIGMADLVKLGRRVNYI